MSTPRFLDLHIVQPVPFANLNRDDLGSPKTVQFGGAERTRISSQCWKRAVRLHLEGALGDPAVRTRRMVQHVAERLVARGFTAELALFGAQQILKSAPTVKAGGFKSENADGTSSVLLYLPLSTLDRLADLVDEHREAVEAEAGKKKPAAVLPAEQVTALLSERNPTVNLFGRMLAELPEAEVDGAVQVAHAFTTHATTVEVDFFTAVDDLNARDDHGSGHMNSGAFAAGVFYRYACLDLAGFTANLGEDRASAREVTEHLVNAFLASMPTGKTNATAPNTLPELAYFAVRSDRPVSLAGAFEAPVRALAEGGYGLRSRQTLAEHAGRLHRLWSTETVLAHGHAGLDEKALEGLGQQHRSFAELTRATVAAAYPEAAQ